jgi:hypothetical protein
MRLMGAVQVHGFGGGDRQVGLTENTKLQCRSIFGMKIATAVTIAIALPMTKVTPARQVQFL